MKLLITSSLIMLTSAGCALAPEQIKTADTQTLCAHYGGLTRSDRDYLRPEIKDELVSRNNAACTDPNLVYMRLQRKMQRSAAMSGVGMFMMGYGQTKSANTIILHR